MDKILSLHDLLQEQLGVKTTSRENPMVEEVLTTITQIVPGNPQRLALVIINLGTSSVYVSMNNNPSAANGIYLGANGGYMSLNWKDDFELVSRTWYGIAIGANSDCYTLETNSQ